MQICRKSADTDVFTLLVHFRHLGALSSQNIYLESPFQQRSVIDIDAKLIQNY